MPRSLLAASAHRPVPLCLSLVLSLLLVLFSPAAAQRNLVTNGNFETGDLTGWTTPLGTFDTIQGATSLQVLEAINGQAGPNGRAYSGRFSVGWDGPYLQSISQSIRLQNGHQFILSFFVMYPDADLLSNFSLTIQFSGGYGNNTAYYALTTLFTQLNYTSPPPFWWTQYTATFTSPRAANSVNLTFSCSNPGYGTFVDYITLYDQGASNNLSLSVSAPAAAPAIQPNPSNNLIINGDFEAGTVWPWVSATGDNPYPYLSYDDGAYNSIYITGESSVGGAAIACPQGFWCFVFGAPYATIPLLYTVNVSSSTNYTLSFRYSVLGGYNPSNPADGGSLLGCSYYWSTSPDSLTSLLRIVNATNVTSNAFFRRSLGAPPSGASSLTIRFDGYSYATFNIIDYVQLIASSASSNAAAAGSQLLVNGDFEQGVVSSSPGWYSPSPAVNLTASSTGLGPGGQSYNGYYSAAWGTSTSNQSITQQVSVTAGSSLLLSFYLFFMDADVDAEFQCSYQFNTQSTATVLTTNANFPTAPPFWWTQFTYTLTAPSGASSLNLSFTGYDPDYAFFLDAVTLTVGGSGVSFPAPPPAVGDNFPPGNLLANGDFESGTIAPWRQPVGDTSAALEAAFGLGAWDFLNYDGEIGVNCIQGYYCMVFGAPYATMPLIQTVNVSSSNSYTWSFYYSNYGGYTAGLPAGSLLAASYYWGSNATLNYVLNLVNLSTAVVNQGFTIELGSPPSGTTNLTLRFDGFSYPSFNVLDLVVLTAQGTGTNDSNLITNGDFEVGGYGSGYGYGGTLDGWSTPLGTFDSSPYINATVLFVITSDIGAGPSGLSYSGLSSLVVEGQSLHSISQTVSTIPGHQYVLSFFVMYSDADSSSLLTVSYQFNTASSGTVLMTQAQFPTAPPFWWTQLTYSIVAPASGTQLNLTFAGADIGYGYLIDYVTLYDQGAAGAATTVTAPPPPPAVAANPAGNLVINGDFELGTLWPWRESGGDNPFPLSSSGEGAFNSIDFGDATYPCPQGYWCAWFGVPYYDLPLLTAVNVTAGQLYTLSFMYVNYGGYSAAETGEMGNYFAASYYYGSSSSSTPIVLFSQTNITTQTGGTLSFNIGPVPSGVTQLSLRFDGWSYDLWITLDYITLLPAVAGSSSSSSSAAVLPAAVSSSSSTGNAASTSTAASSPAVSSSSPAVSSSSPAVSSSSSAAVTSAAAVSSAATVSSAAAAVSSSSSSSGPAAAGGSSSSSGLSGGAIAGIVIGSVVGALLLLLCVLFLCLRAGKKEETGEKYPTVESSHNIPSESSQIRTDDGVELQPHSSA